MHRRPAPLRPGDPVRVVAPSGPFDRERFDAGIAWLARRYEPRFTEEVFARHGYVAGRLDLRQGGLLQALADPHAKAVFCARGGYGAAHLLPALRLDGHVGLLVGFSDVTALHLAWQAAGRVSIHGPVVTQLAELPADDEQRLLHLLEAPTPAPPVSGTATVVAGTAAGTLVGGNLAVLTSLVGTPYLPDLHGAVLLLEDVGERPYRLDRMWTQLLQSGALDGVAGIVLGDFTRCDDDDATAAEVLAELAAAVGAPCAAGFPFGHGLRNVPVALGTTVVLDADAAQITFREAAVTT